MFQSSYVWEHSSVLGNLNITSWKPTYAPGVGVFLYFPVLSAGGCEYMWVVALSVVLPCAVCVCVCVAGSFTVLTVGCCTVDCVFLFTV